MPVRQRGGDWVRVPYEARHYTAPPQLVRQIRAGNEDYGSRELLEQYDGPFRGLMKVREVDRGGKRYAVLVHYSTDHYGLEVELTDDRLGEIRALPPEEAWKLVREIDARQSPPVGLDGA